MKNLLLAAGAFVALGVLGSNEAAAQHCRSGHGYGYGGYGSPGLSVSIGYGGYTGGYAPYGSGYSGYGNAGYGYQTVPVYQGHSHNVWHDTTHLDYHGPSLMRHRGHYDYVPGHYDVHQSGHWDRYGGW